MASDRVEVGIAMEEIDAIPHRDGCDEAVGQKPDGCARTAARTIERGSALVIGRLFERKEVAARKQTA